MSFSKISDHSQIQEISQDKLSAPDQNKKATGYVKWENGTFQSTGKRSEASSPKFLAQKINEHVGTFSEKSLDNAEKFFQQKIKNLEDKEKRIESKVKTNFRTCPKSVQSLMIKTKQSFSSIISKFKNNDKLSVFSKQTDKSHYEDSLTAVRNRKQSISLQLETGVSANSKASGSLIQMIPGQAEMQQNILDKGKNLEEAQKNYNLAFKNERDAQLNGTDAEKELATKGLQSANNKLFVAQSNYNNAISKSDGAVRDWALQSDNNFQVFSDNLINKIPNARFSSAHSTSTPEALDYNNNGLKGATNIIYSEGKEEQVDLENGTTLTLKPVKQADIDGITHTFPENHVYSDPSGMLFYRDENGHLNDARYHDYVKASGGEGEPAIITLCDGSGHDPGARTTAIVAADAAHDILNKNLGNCTDLHSAMQMQMTGLSEANKALQKQNTGGATTFIQVGVVGNTLFGISVGDSKAYVFRPKEGGGFTCLDPLGNAKGTLDSTDSGGQLTGKTNDKSEIQRTHAFAMTLNPGDIVYVCSDGIVDNFEPAANKKTPSSGAKDWENQNTEHIKESLKWSKDKMEEVVKECKSGSDISEKLLNFVSDVSKEKKLSFFQNARNPDTRQKTGKLDDAATAFFEYKPAA